MKKNPGGQPVAREAAALNVNLLCVRHRCVVLTASGNEVLEDSGHSPET